MERKYDICFIILSYNTSKYIKEAIESVLCQTYSGNWFLLIADDCSTDESKTIIEEYAQLHPERIKVHVNVKNLGIAGNTFTAFDISNSKYIAYIDGDDYLIDPDYLVKQFSIMEANPNVSMSLFDGYNFDDTDKANCTNLIQIPESTFTDFYSWCRTGQPAFNPQSFFIRRDSLPLTFEKWMYNSEYQDWLIILLALLSGPIHFTYEKATMHRLHANNFSKIGLAVSRVQGGIDLVNNINNYTDKKYKSELGDVIWRYDKLAFAHYFEGNWLKAITTSVYFLINVPDTKRRDIKLVFLKIWYKVLRHGFIPYQ